MSIHNEIARFSVEYYFEHSKLLKFPDDLPDNILEKIPNELVGNRRGTFVSWHDGNDNLRGCIGTFMPTKSNVAEEIIVNAVSSAVDDPRFSPMNKDELDSLHCKVDVLSELEQVHNIEKDLNPKKYGVFVTTPDGRSGLLLPDLDGVDTVYQQLSIASQKGGIDPVDDDISVSRFTVDRFEE